MRGTVLNFTGDAPVFDFSQVLIDFGCTVQNALVNTATDLGSDPVYPDRGTHLKIDGAQGRMVNSVWASQSASFAALRTLSFIQKTEMQANAFKLQTFILQCSSLTNQSAQLQTKAVGTDGTIVGILATL